MVNAKNVFFLNPQLYPSSWSKNEVLIDSMIEFKFCTAPKYTCVIARYEANRPWGAHEYLLKLNKRFIIADYAWPKCLLAVASYLAMTQKKYRTQLYPSFC